MVYAETSLSRGERARFRTLLLCVFAWVSTLGVLVTIVAMYDRLPDALPVTRWSSAPRSPVLAFRIPAINVLSVVFVHVLVRTLSRSPLELEAHRVATALFPTVAIKALIEGIELILLPSTSPLILPGLGLTLLIGIGAAIAAGRKFLDRSSRPPMQLTTPEKVVTSLAFLAVVGFQFAPVLE